MATNLQRHFISKGKTEEHTRLVGNTDDDTTKNLLHTLGNQGKRTDWTICTHGAIRNIGKR